MVACTRRIAAVSLGIQATSLHTERADHAAWCRPSPHAPLSQIKPLATAPIPSVNPGASGARTGSQGFDFGRDGMLRLALATGAVFALTLAVAAAGASNADVFTYRTVLTARAEVPKPTAPVGAGGVFTSKVTKDGTSYSIAWKLTFKKLSGPAVAAHVHRGRAGVAGGVILALCGPCRSGQSGRATVTKAVAEAMRRGTAYVNVHTAKNSA